MDKGEYYFHINNYGVNAAKDVQIALTAENEINELKHLNHSRLVKSTIKFLAPGQNLNTYLGSYDDLIKNNELPILATKISFFDLDNNEYERNYVLDMNVFKGRFFRIEKDMTDLTKQVTEIDKTLSKIAMTIHDHIRELKAQKEVRYLSNRRIKRK